MAANGISTLATKASGSIFVTDTDLAIRTYPHPFNEVPSTSIFVEGTESVSQIRWAVSGITQATTTEWGSYRIADSTSGSGTIRINFLAIGRWK